MVGTKVPLYSYTLTVILLYHYALIANKLLNKKLCSESLILLPRVHNYVHSRNVEDCGGAPRRKSTLKPAKILCITMWQDWLGNNKPKKAFRLILNVLKIFLKKSSFLLTD